MREAEEPGEEPLEQRKPGRGDLWRGPRPQSWDLWQIRGKWAENQPDCTRTHIRTHIHTHTHLALITLAESALLPTTAYAGHLSLFCPVYNTSNLQVGPRATVLLWLKPFPFKQYFALPSPALPSGHVAPTLGVSLS